MTLYEEALIQYDELEASFFQVLRGIMYINVISKDVSGY
jgi:hypothetical protein